MHLFSIFQDSHPEGIQMKELYTKYQASRKTLSNDMKELEQDLIQVYDKPILKKRTDGNFYLEVDLHFSFQKLSLFYAENSRNFWIFNKIVKNQSKTIKELSENVFYSQSAVYGSVNQLKEYFQSLSISWSFFEIKGDERKIRHLLFESYWSLFGGISWPFDRSRESLVSEVQQFEKKGWIFNELEQERLLYWLAITEIRINNGYILATRKKVTIEDVEVIIPFTFFLEKYCSEEYATTDFEEEIYFFMNTLVHFMGCSLSNVNETRGSLTIEVSNIEEQLLQKGEAAGWDSNQLQQFASQLKKIRYHWEEDILEWYHFLKPQAEIYFNESKPFMDNSIKNSFNKISSLLGSAFIYECKKFGLFFVVPIRIQIISKEGSTIEVEKILQQFSEYPIEFDQQKGARVDIFLTNFLAKQDCKELNRNNYFFYDWPLKKNKVSMILEQGMALKMNGKAIAVNE